MERLHRRRDFEALARDGIRRHAHGVTVRWSPRPAGSASSAAAYAVAYAVGRRCGSAVVRNRLRRRLREIMRTLESELKPGMYLVQVGPSAVDMSFHGLSEVLRRALEPALTSASRQDAGSD